MAEKRKRLSKEEALKLKIAKSKEIQKDLKDKLSKEKKHEKELQLELTELRTRNISDEQLDMLAKLKKHGISYEDVLKNYGIESN